jgi:hypothetical protein
MLDQLIDKETLANKFSHIKGWGIDANPDNEPTYPMKNYTGDDHNRSSYKKAKQQPKDIEILKSNERPQISAVFGTSVPPSGFSGVIRRYAFHYSESNWMHWLSLILADRINVFEGIVDDLGKGNVPNVFAERGWKSEIKYNKAGLATRVIINVAVTAAVVAFVFRKRIWKNKKAL